MVTDMADRADQARNRVPESRLDFDPELVWYQGGERFTGVAVTEYADGSLDEEWFRDGYRDGPSRTVRADGTYASEDWYREGVRHGISRTFLEDGTVASAEGWEYGYPRWSASIDADGTVHAREAPPLDDTQRRYTEQRREHHRLPPPRPPSDAADPELH